MICSDPPEAGGLHAGPPATEVAQSSAYRASAPWTPLRIGLMLGAIAVGFAIVAGLIQRRFPS